MYPTLQRVVTFEPLWYEGRGDNDMIALPATLVKNLWKAKLLSRTFKQEASHRR